MRHAEREDKDNHAKEHIVCEADDHGEHLSIEKTNFGNPPSFENSDIPSPIFDIQSRARPFLIKSLGSGEKGASAESVVRRSRRFMAMRKRLFLLLSSVLGTEEKCAT